MSKHTSAPLTPALSPEGERGRPSSSPLTPALSPEGERGRPSSSPLTPALSPEGERGRSSSSPLPLTPSPEGERQAFRHPYVPIPFCKHKCGYCDFNSYAGMDRLMPDYVDALERGLAFARARHP